ncbi:hypothetical protein GPY61_30295 [Massilia sp. NEAU-DD11]|uniref:Uncharacterized protein n=1 Tax=Massilia cellulosiltytica TaxID=2683234 RepID=A0A7X3G5U1_9BURK|nr:hypothetical protein [Telluria cellulosilytica]MVW64226.1 hypothetical protein [Telluria cellulosilytica]
MNKRERFAIFLSRLNDAPPGQNREDSFTLMSRIMDEVEDELSGVDRSNFGERMRVWGWEFGWKNLGNDPCFWDDSMSATHRTHIYHNGRILITAIRNNHVVVLDKPGAN